MYPKTAWKFNFFLYLIDEGICNLKSFLNRAND